MVGCTWLAVSWVVLGLANAAGPQRLQQCPTNSELVHARCDLTMPNFTQWCTADEKEPEYSEYYFFTSAKECVRADINAFSFAPKIDPKLVAQGRGRQQLAPFTARKCTLCAPFTDLEECRRVCEEGYVETTADENSEIFKEFDIAYFLRNVFIALYACYGLALCCEDFFVSSLEILIDRAKVPADVAGATFMAAGSSSPELFVAAVTIFLPKDADVCQAGEACIHKDPGLGVGTVVGSTMFNTMVIIGGSAIISGKSTDLDWRIVARDATSYIAAILTLLYVLMDETCEEGQCIESKDVNGKTVDAVDMKGWGTVRWYEALSMICVYVGYVVLCWKYSVLTGWLCPAKASESTDLDAWISTINQAPGSPQAAVAAAAAAGGSRSVGEAARFTVGSDEPGADDGHAGEGTDGHGHGSRDESCADTLRNLFRAPDSPVETIVWLFSLPLMTAFTLTIVDCRNRRFENYFMVTMVLAICWLGFIVDFMVHAFEEIAGDLHMTESTIGLVFSAAGTSFPDFLASLIVAKKGMADMAVSGP